MSDNNFIRFFVILNEQEKGYGISGAPNGYCKVESLDGKAVFTFSIRNIKTEKNGYKLFITLKDSSGPVFISDAVPVSGGNIYKSVETNAENVFDSGNKINKVEAMYVLNGENAVVMSGYLNRNVSQQQKQNADMKINSIPKAKENVFEAAATDMNDVQFDTTLPEEIEASATPLEAENIQQEQEKKDESGTENNVASYVSTLAKLYEGLIGTKKHDEKTENGNYWSLVGDFYNALSNNGDTSMFPFSTNNTKWIRINDENSVEHRIIGIVYEDGKPKYIANGIAQRTGMMFTQYPSDAIWFPLKNERLCVCGYWILFVDASTGKAVLPDFKIL